MGKTSKRAQQVSLTKVRPKGKDLKAKLHQQLSAYLEIFPTLFVFTYSNFKTEPLRKLRENFTTSKFLLGKSKVLQSAVAAHPELKSLASLKGYLKGSCGILFTKESPESMIEFFQGWSESVSLLPGQIACESVLLRKGVGNFEKFSNTIEPYLRTLGLPTKVHDGKIEMLADFEVCRAGEPVGVEKSKILKLLHMDQGEMKIDLKAVWKGGEFRELSS